MGYPDWKGGDHVPPERRRDSLPEQRARRHAGGRHRYENRIAAGPTGGKPAEQFSTDDGQTGGTSAGGEATGSTGGTASGVRFPIRLEWREVPANTRRTAGPAEGAYHPFDGFTELGHDAPVDAGPWHRVTDTGEWGRGSLADLETSGVDLTAVGQDGLDGYGAAETFWEGTRLAGDDPRWMPTPASAPRSPAVSYPPRPPATPYPGPARSQPALDPVFPTGTAPAQPDGPLWHAPLPQPPFPKLADADLSLIESAVPTADPDEAYPSAWPARRRGPGGERNGPLAAMLFAATWYVVPLLVLFVWMLTLDGSAPAGCVTDAAGRGCESRQAEAAASIVAAAPQFGVAIGASLVVAALLRQSSAVWRAATVGLVAAVIGGGMSTALFQLVTHQAG